ncbi:MAG: cyclic nucleotide-binding domain-containing protein [Roseicyclus sp.]
MEDRDTLTVFALGGLGGGNAFGAGVLRALTDLDIYPDVITCTSGMVAWTALYLAGVDLKEELRRGEAMQSLEGVPEMLKPAVMGAMLLKMNHKTIQANMMNWMKPITSFNDFADAAMPVRVLDPFLTPEQLEFYATAMRDSEVGVIFNAYEPTSGTEILYANDAARARVPLEDMEGRRIEEITPVGVEAALWLSHYGYTRPDGAPQMALDGAYRRQFILQEVMNATRLFVARPEHRKYLGRMPRNQLEQKVFETYMWFSAAYRSEIQMIRMANKWTREGRLTGRKVTDIVEIENEIPMTFDSYFTETMESMERARASTIARFDDAWLDPKLVLRKIAFMEGLPTAFLQRLANCLAPVEPARGEAVVTKGEPGDAMYIIIAGGVTVETGKGIPLQPGDFFGEMALLEDVPRNATVRAGDGCKLFRLSRRDFHYLCRIEPAFEARVASVADSRKSVPLKASA